MNVGGEFFYRKKKDLNVSLNEIQKKAVLHTEGPLLLLASPGSGKTTTIIMRIGYLIEEKSIDPSRIKAITFSQASATDMKERYSRFFPKLLPVDFSTIHSFAFKVVRDYFYKNNTDYQLIEGNNNRLNQSKTNVNNSSSLNKKTILRKLFKSITDETITEDQLDELTTYITFIKNKLIPQNELSSVSCDIPNAERILIDYEKFKKSDSKKLLVDYDDMLTIANDALESDMDILLKYQKMYDYILTDESQDTSMVQHLIIEKLVKEHTNLTVVADDDQSIYTWRAAEPQYLLDFKQVYPQADILMMEQNYRSSRDIVDVANTFIKRNKKRYDKNMFTENPPNKPIIRKSLTDYTYQSKYLAEHILKEKNLSDIAVLYRNNSSSIILVNEFDLAGIPFFLRESENRFFSHWIIEDILNFMRITFNNKRTDLLEKIHTKFNGYITKQQIEDLKKFTKDQSVFDNLLNHVELRDYQVKNIKKCKEIFRKMEGISPLDAIRMIRHDLGYEKALEKMSESLGMKIDYLLGILHTLEEISSSLETMEEFANRLKYLDSVMKASKYKKNFNAVTLATFHSSKGLEFNRVYMIDLIEGVIPSKSDSDSYSEGKTDQMEEAVRLFYVGMTRAELHLELLSYKKKHGKETKASQFLADINRIIDPAEIVPRDRPVDIIALKKIIPYNPNAINDATLLKVGVKVKHRVFNIGEIIKVDNDSIEIRFKVGQKKLLISACIELGILEPIK